MGGGLTLAEVAVVLALVYGLYRLMAPLAARLEKALLRLLDRQPREVIDVSPERERKDGTGER